jgi:hypothetical protein
VLSPTAQRIGIRGFEQDVKPQLKSPLARTLTNVGTNILKVGESAGTDVSTGLQRTFKGDVAAGLAQTARGGGKYATLAPPFLPTTLTTTTAASLDQPVGKNDVLRRAGTGFFEGYTGVKPTDVGIQSKNINVFGAEFDPLQSAAGMVGFVKNPLNKQLFKATEAILPGASKKLTTWLGVTASRGGLENILLNLPEKPENMTDMEKVSWMVQNGVAGGVQEIVGRGVLGGLSKAADVTGINKAVSKGAELSKKELTKMFDAMAEFKRKATIPVSKPGFGAKLGQTITEPMWKWEMGMVDDGSMQRFESTIDTPKLAVEPTLSPETNQFMQAVRNKFPGLDENLTNTYARKIADLQGSKDIKVQHIAEAVQYTNPSYTPPNFVNTSRLFDKTGRNSNFTGNEMYDRQIEVGATTGLDPELPKLFKKISSKLENIPPETKQFLDALINKKFNTNELTVPQLKELDSIITRAGKNLTPQSISKALSPQPDLLTEARPTEYQKYKEVIKKYQRSEDGLVSKMFSDQRVREKQKGFKKVDYTKEEFGNFLKNNSKYKSIYDNWVKSGYDPQLKPSVDRIDPKKGYSLDNIQVGTWAENDIKGRGEMRITQGKPIVQLDKDGNVIKIHRSLSDAADETGLNFRSISNAALGSRGVKSTGGYSWRYATPDEISPSLYNQAKGEPKIVTPIRRPLKEVYAEKLTGVTREEPQIKPQEAQTQGTLLEAPKPVVSSDSILSLPQGEIKTYSPAQAKSRFKQSGKTIPFVTKLKPGETPITIPSGGVTGKQLYQEGTPITEKQAIDQWDKAVADYANGITRTKRSVSVEPTIKTISSISDKSAKLKVQNQKKLDDEWQKAVFGEAQTRTARQAEKDLEKAIKTSTNEATFKLDTADSWKDKNALSLGTETMDRNFEDIMGKQAPELKRKLLEPVYKSEAQRTKFLNTEREQIKKLGIKAGSKESSLVQEYGEGNITREQLAQKTNNPDKIIKASEFIRGKYDEYLGQLNKVLTRNGYEPIPKRSDYFHHFQELTGAFDLLGVSLKAQDLPTDINGLTADFKPGKTFFSAALQRLGGEYKSDAIGGIDKYLEGASNQIYHTDNIQALRSFETALREKFAGTNHLSNFVANLSEYTNGIAGKKSMIDRAAESIVGRGIYGAATGLKRQVGANMVGANVSSALTNFIPLTQTLATTDKGSVLNAIMATIKNVGKDDGFIQASDFLTTRHGTDRLAKSLYENVADKAGWLFKNVDSFVSQVVTRSKYLEGIKKGMSESDAMDYANSWAKKLMAGRGKGEMPTLFNSQTLGAITQFQLEVKNQLSFMAKDIPRNFDKVGAASAIAQLFLYGYLFNNLYEKMTGRRPAFDPIGVGQRTYEDYTNPDMKKGQATKNLVKNVSDQLPFVSTFTGGRLPITSAIPNPMKVVSGESTIGKELTKPLQFILPTGGGQIKKTYEGIKAYNQGASTTPSGNVRFTIPQTPANRIRTALFGQWSTPEAQKYLREGQTPLGEKQSELFMQSKDKQVLFDKIRSNQLSERQLTAVKDTLKKNNVGSATVTGGKYVYMDDSTGDIKTIDTSKVSSMPTSTRYDQVKKEQEKWKLADDILKLSPQDQSTAFKELGIAKEDASYYSVATNDTVAKYAYVQDQVQGARNYQEFLQKAIPLMREVNGKAILSSSVIDELYNNDVITSAQKKQLKSIDFSGAKPKLKSSGTTKAKYVKAVMPKSVKTSLPKVKRIRTKRYKLVIPKVK